MFDYETVFNKAQADGDFKAALRVIRKEMGITMEEAKDLMVHWARQNNIN